MTNNVSDEVWSAISAEIGNSIAKEINGYCERLGSIRIIDMAESYGGTADVVGILEWLSNFNVLVVMTDRLKRVFSIERSKTSDKDRLEYLDRIEKTIYKRPQH